MPHQIIGVADTAGIECQWRTGGQWIIRAAFLCLYVQRKGSKRLNVQSQDRSIQKPFWAEIPGRIGGAHRSIASLQNIEGTIGAKSNLIGYMIPAGTG